MADILAKEIVAIPLSKNNVYTHTLEDDISTSALGGAFVLGQCFNGPQKIHQSLRRFLLSLPSYSFVALLINSSHYHDLLMSDIALDNLRLQSKVPVLHS